MRPSKFRASIAWTPAGTVGKVIETFYFTLKDLNDPHPPFSIREIVIPWLQEGNEPDRETGLTDCKGKEIYEGDIVVNDSLAGGFIGHIVWDTACLLIAFNDDSSVFTALDEDFSCLEVKGNIHENPELLETKIEGAKDGNDQDDDLR